MRGPLYQATYLLLVTLCAAGILWVFARGGGDSPEFLGPGRVLRSVDTAEIERQVQQGRLSDREAMYYQTVP